MVAATRETGPANDRDDERAELTLVGVSAKANAAADAATRVHQELSELKGEVSEGFGRVASELSETRGVTESIAKHLRIPVPDRKTIPPPSSAYRPPLQSYTDLDEEITLHGTRRLSGTEEQINAVIETKVHSVLRQKELEASDVIVKGAKSGAWEVSKKLLYGLALVAGAGLWHFVERLLEHH